MRLVPRTGLCPERALEGPPVRIASPSSVIPEAGGQLPGGCPHRPHWLPHPVVRPRARPHWAGTRQEVPTALCGAGVLFLGAPGVGSHSRGGLWAAGTARQVSAIRAHPGPSSPLQTLGAAPRTPSPLWGPRWAPSRPRTNPFGLRPPRTRAGCAHLVLLQVKPDPPALSPGGAAGGQARPSGSRRGWPLCDPRRLWGARSAGARPAPPLAAGPALTTGPAPRRRPRLIAPPLTAGPAIATPLTARSRPQCHAPPRPHRQVPPPAPRVLPGQGRCYLSGCSSSRRPEGGRGGGPAIGRGHRLLLSIPAARPGPAPTAERRRTQGRGGCRDWSKMAGRLGSAPASGREPHSLPRC